MSGEGTESGRADHTLLVLYLADGAMLGAVLYYLVGIVVVATTVDAAQPFGFEFLAIGLVLGLFLLLGTERVRAALQARAAGRWAREHRKWRQARQVLWVLLAAAAVATVLVAVTLVAIEPERRWLAGGSDLLFVGTLVAGLVLRLVVLHVRADDVMGPGNS